MAKVKATAVLAALATTSAVAAPGVAATALPATDAAPAAAPVVTVKKTLSERAKALFETTPIDVADRGRAFRKTILQTLMAEFPGTTIASAAGAYNNAKTAAQKANPTKFENLGREPGKNNGGPKKRPAAETEVAAEAESATA